MKRLGIAVVVLLVISIAGCSKHSSKVVASGKSRVNHVLKNSYVDRSRLEISVTGKVQLVFTSMMILGDPIDQGFSEVGHSPGLINVYLPPVAGTSFGMSFVGDPGATITISAEIVGHKDWGNLRTITKRVQLDENGEGGIAVRVGKIYHNKIKLD